MTFFGRILFRIVRRRIEGLESHRNQVLLIGNSSVAKHLIETSGTFDNRLTVVGVLDDVSAIGTEVSGGIKVLGKLETLAECAKGNNVHGS